VEPVSEIGVRILHYRESVVASNTVSTEIVLDKAFLRARFSKQLKNSKTLLLMCTPAIVFFGSFEF
jgi:hypothetical protein